MSRPQGRLFLCPDLTRYVASTTVGKLQYYRGSTGVLLWEYWSLDELSFSPDRAVFS